jgi:dTDP-4-dehydrorhamnose reductase
MVFDYPKILHLIWKENFECNFLNYITPISFQKYHPDWKIYIYYYDNTSVTNNRYLNYLKKDSRIHMKNVGDILEGLGFQGINLSPQQKNDIIKIYALETVGGVYSDFDITYLKNIEDCFSGYKSDMILFYDNNNREKIVFDFAISKRVISPTRPTFQELQKNICRGYDNLGDINCLGAGMFVRPENRKFMDKITLLSDINYRPITFQNAGGLLKGSSLNSDLFALKWWEGSQVDKKYLENTKKYLYSTLDKIVSPYKIVENIVPETMGAIATTKKISIVMAYINRIEQLSHTLNTISKSIYKNIEVIIVDDGSVESERIEGLIDYYDFEIKLVTIKEIEKNWVNPCIPYNIALSKSTGDIIIIQNPEVCHVGDIISYCSEHANDLTYLTFSVISSASQEDNQKIYNYMKTGKIIPHWDVKSVFNPHSWYNHPTCRNSQFHFLSCMTRNTLTKIGGFNEKFKDGLSYDDNEFVSRIRKVVKCKTLSPDIGFGIHLWHTGGSTVLYSKSVEPVQTLTALNRRLYEELENSDIIYTPRSDYTHFELTKINKNVIIFGSNGMLGKYISTYLENQKFNIIEINRDQFNVELATPKTIMGLLTPHLKPNTVIINCIGKIPQKLDNSVHNLKTFTRINTLFPIYLSLVVEKINSTALDFTRVRFIHITTDCVFSGNSRVLGGYLETDIQDSEDVYGMTKSMGETDTDTVIRTSIIGEEIYSKKSLLEWVKSNKNGVISGYSTHYWNGVTCLELSKIIYNMTRQGIFWKGIRHIHSEKSVSKYQLVTYINEIWNLGITIEKKSEGAVNRTLGGSGAGATRVSGDILQQLKELKEYDILSHVKL